MNRRIQSRVDRRAARGFTLIEIMVAVVVICVGLLGIAKMQALALSGSNVARQRSMAAFLAASLASSMHSNRTFWASAAAVTPPGAPITVTSSTGTITPATLVPAGTCFGGATVVPTCPGVAGALTLAGWDLTRWSASVSQLLPNAVTTISCPGLVAPPSCTIQMAWTEQTVMATSTAQVNNNGEFQNPTYTLYVEP